MFVEISNSVLLINQVVKYVHTSQYIGEFEMPISQYEILGIERTRTYLQRTQLMASSRTQFIQTQYFERTYIYHRFLPTYQSAKCGHVAKDLWRQFLKKYLSKQDLALILATIS